ncbi:MAG: hypothetical protein AAF192_23440 [Pseudomonadota bacterium]
MTEATGWSLVWKANAAFLRAGACVGLGWAFWRLSLEPGYALAILITAMFAIAFVKHAVVALAAVVRLLLRQTAWSRYRRQAGAPKADKMAGDADLRRQGLIR